VWDWRPGVGVSRVRWTEDQLHESGDRSAEPAFLSTVAIRDSTSERCVSQQLANRDDRPVLAASSQGRSDKRGCRTLGRKRGSLAPHALKFSRACFKLRLPFGPPRTTVASSSSCPSSSQKHTGQISKPPRSARVRCRQQGQDRPGFSLGMARSGWRVRSMIQEVSAPEQILPRRRAAGSGRNEP
jgi:hypothetical protein